MAKKYYNPETREYVVKKGKLPPESRGMVQCLNQSGIFEKRLINQVLRGEKGGEQVIEEGQSSGQTPENLLDQEARARLFEAGNPWLTILRSFGCEISEERSAEEIREAVQRVFNAYYAKHEYLPLLQKLYEKSYGTDQAKELFEKLLALTSKPGSLINAYKHLHRVFNDLRQRFLEAFGSESEILRAAEKVSRRRFYDILGLHFEQLDYIKSFTEEERRDLEASLESLFITTDVPSLVKQINRQLETSLKNLKKRFVDWHDELYIRAGYPERLEEFNRLKAELGATVRLNPACMLEDRISSAYKSFSSYQPIKLGHLSSRKINIIMNSSRVRCLICQAEKSLPGALPERGELRVSQILGEIQTKIREGKALLSLLGTTNERGSVQIADIDLTIDSLRKLFRSIQEADDQYGIKYFADVLKGSKNKKVLEREGQKLPAYGLLSRHRTEDIMRMLDQLVTRKLLRINDHYDSGVYYPLVSLTDRAHPFLQPIAPTREAGRTPGEPPIEDAPRAVSFDKNTIVRTFSQFDPDAKRGILEKLARSQEMKILRELFRHLEGKERHALVENAIKYLEKPCLEPFLLSLFHFGNGKKDEDIEKLKLASCDYFREHLDRRLLPIFQLKVAQEKDATVKKKLQDIVAHLENQVAIGNII